MPQPEGVRLGGTVRDIAVDGGFVRTETRGSGPVLVLLHGWTLDRRMWLPQLPLAEHFTLVTLDRRGFGQSSAPAETRAEPDDLLAIAAALGLEQFHLLGMSQAGRVALRFAADHPERVLSLVLQGTPADGVPQGPDELEDVPISAMSAAAASGDFAEMRRLWGAHPLVKLQHPRWQATLDAILADYEARDLLQPGPGVAAGLETLSVPVLAIAGAHDTAWRRRIAALLGDAPHSHDVTIPAAGHLCNMDQPAVFNALIGQLA